MTNAEIEKLANRAASDAWQIEFRKQQAEGLDLDEATELADAVAVAVYDAEFDRLVEQAA